MFYDRAKIYVRGGDGGNGIVAYRREKYVPAGGPAGGDGGRGGDVVLVADKGLRTLADFKYRQHYRAPRGEHGGGKNMNGASAPDLELKVPLGTVVRDAASGELLADIVQPGQRVVVAAGGRGGRGNASFASGRNKAPSFAEKGEPGEERWLLLELKLLADVGLVGFPNAGKSTLLASLSAARPKIGDYPFTTVVPNLGVVDLGEGNSFVLADIPGLIEGSHAGAGLGFEFLRHVERTRILVHVLDMSGVERDPVRAFHALNRELALYNKALAERPQVVAANKMDLPGAGEALTALQKQLGGRHEIFPVSAASGRGVRELAWRLWRMLQEMPRDVPAAAGEEERVVLGPAEPFQVRREGRTFVVTGRQVERRVAMTDLTNREALQRLQRALRRMGVEESLRRMGAREGDPVRVRDWEFEFRE